MCNGCSTPVANPITCPSCGISPHPGASCLTRCSRPWMQGKLLSRAESSSSKAPSSLYRDGESALIAEMSELLGAKFTKLESELRVFQSNLELLDTALGSVRSKVDSLETRIKSKEETLAAEAIEEIAKRSRRAKNLILFNVPESDPPTGLSAVKEILRNIQEDFCNAGVSVRRLGRNPNTDRPRPICVVFPSSTTRIAVLRGRSRYKGPVRLAQDQTQMQRTYLSNLGNKLRDLNDPLKTIKYVNGVPRIVSASQHSKNASETH